MRRLAADGVCLLGCPHNRDANIATAKANATTRTLRPHRLRGRGGTKVLLRMRKLSAFITTYVSDHLMKFLKIFALAVALLTTAQAVQKPSAHTKGTPTGKQNGKLK